MKLSPKDLYRLRLAQLVAQRGALRAQQAEQTLRELVLEMEQQYGLLGTTSSIDVHTGEVRVTSDPDNIGGRGVAEG
ncbi:MAG: hypothetical protein HW388_727 [Dehalococcoidia bacterium]|nr:hypothetical protein [Dehalococcoidia bacterium]